MYVLVQHMISRPADFWGPADRVGFPIGLQLHHTFANEDGTRAVCLWEGDSVESVRRFLERTVGHVSKNEYFQVANRDGIVEPSLTKSRASG